MIGLVYYLGERRYGLQLGEGVPRPQPWIRVRLATRGFRRGSRSGSGRELTNWFVECLPSHCCEEGAPAAGWLGEVEHHHWLVAGSYRYTLTQHGLSER